MKSGNRKLPRPTDAELEILRILWEREQSTVRDVHEAIDARRPTGYTTVLKQLQIMTEKGLVRRDASERAHVYRARLAREETEKQLVGDLLDRAFGGSASRLVLHALASTPASPEEIAQIRKLLEDADADADAGRAADKPEKTKEGRK